MIWLRDIGYNLGQEEKKKWQVFPNMFSIGDKNEAKKFVANTRESFHRVGLKGRFRILKKMI